VHRSHHQQLPRASPQPWCSSLSGEGWACGVAGGPRLPASRALLPLPRMQQALPVYHASRLPPTEDARGWAQEAGRGAQQTPALGGPGEGGGARRELPCLPPLLLPSLLPCLPPLPPAAHPLPTPRRLRGCRRGWCQQTRPLSPASGMR